MDQPALASYQLIRYRRRGYGSSPEQASRVTIPENASDLADLLRFLGVRRAHIVGHSYGGLVGLQLALDRPDVAGSVVLMEPALRTAALRANLADPAVEDLHRRMSVGFQRYRDGDREGAVEGFLGATFGPGYRQQLEQVVPGWWDQTVRTADAFFGAEVLLNSSRGSSAPARPGRSPHPCCRCAAVPAIPHSWRSSGFYASGFPSWRPLR
jgi:pimeloyl-ACP methyl ester carboxylesterase